MTEDKLERYKKAYYSRPEILASLEDKVNRLCEATESSSWLDTVHWTFELLLITIHTDKGQAMYLKLLNRIAPHFPDRAEKYRAVFNDRKNQAGKP
jgi:hypothetical protein